MEDYVDGFNETVFCFKRLIALNLGQFHDYQAEIFAYHWHSGAECIGLFKNRLKFFLNEEM